MDANQRSCFTEHAIIAIVSNAFWLVILISCIIFFRQEIKNGLNSLSSIDIAGSHLKLENRERAIRSFTTLTNIFVEMLSDGDEHTKFTGMLSVSNAQQLNRFLKAYLEEVKKENWDLTLVKNVAHIAHRKGYVSDSVELYKTLVDKFPDRPDFLEDYGNVLLSLNPGEAKNQFHELVKKYPGQDSYKYNRAMASLKSGDVEDAVNDLGSCLSAEYLGENMRERIKEVTKKMPDKGKELLERHTRLVAERYNRALARMESGDFDTAVADLNTCLNAEYVGDNMLERIKELSKVRPDDGKKLLEDHNKLIAARYVRAMVSLKSGDFDTAASDLKACLNAEYLGNNMRERITELSRGKPDDSKKLLERYNRLVASCRPDTEAIKDR
jgi:tetratricopeptide (TPR) repeat protein